MTWFSTSSTVYSSEYPIILLYSTVKLEQHYLVLCTTRQFADWQHKGSRGDRCGLAGTPDTIHPLTNQLSYRYTHTCTVLYYTIRSSSERCYQTLYNKGLSLPNRKNGVVGFYQQKHDDHLRWHDAFRQLVWCDGLLVSEKCRAEAVARNAVS